MAILIVVLDQLSKYWAYATLIPYQPVTVMPMVNLTLAFNTGAAFSFLSQAGEWHRWFFVAFSSIVSLVLIIWLIKAPTKERLQLASLSFILGGAVGNLLDRILVGHVIDFIDLYYKNYHWPIFNLADVAICTGAVLLVLDLCKNRRAG